MSRHSAVLRRLVKASVLVLGAGIVLAGCAPVKFGSAAIVGNNSITIATLDTDATILSQNAKPFASLFQLSPAEATQATLSWLIRFQINEQLARQAGITVSPEKAQAALQQVYTTVGQELESDGVTNPSTNLILVDLGIPPTLSAEVGRYAAIANAENAKFTHAECLAAKSLKIQVNPQFGRLNYSNYQVVSLASTVTRAEGPVKAASLPGLVPAC